MCGIAGIRTFDGSAVDPATLSRMALCLRHRGPDENATWSEPGVGLSHSRLSIIDLAHSHQPIQSIDQRWVLAFNGEILNYRELRATLDYPFVTEGDTEVILAGLVSKGIGFVGKLRGQFAFAAFDRVSGNIYLARDRLGILPLYYQLGNGCLTFASEIKALRVANPGRSGVDFQSLDAYLAGRSVPAPDTLFADVKKLEPGKWAVIDRNGRMSTEDYWSLPAVDAAVSWTEAAAVHIVDLGVRDAVRAAVVADVPVGSYLSGGVDSSLIAAVANELRPGSPIKTFAAGFGDPRHDELPWARRVSEHLSTEHHEVHIRPDDFQGAWSKLTWHRDAPLSEPADAAVYQLARHAREHVKVILSGEGGDELFAGYPKYRFARAMELYGRLPAGSRRSVSQWLDSRMGAPMTRARTIMRVAGAGTEGERLRTWFSPFTADERRALLGGRDARPARAVPQGDDAVDRMLRFDMASWLPDNLLERGDRMSMAASLELRPPLLDHNLVELAFSMPSSLKLRRGTTKWVLKEVARRYLPDEVVDRKKVGFRVPLDSWFRTALREFARDSLTSSTSFVAQTFNRRSVESLLTRHESHQSNEESRIWTLLSLEIWHQTCVANALQDACMQS